MFALPCCEYANNILNYRLWKFQMETGYKLYRTKNQRILEICSALSCPQGSEVFVSGIPSELMEDELIPFFAIVGTVVKFRLMLHKNNMYNRGFAIVTYCDPNVAHQAVKTLNCVQLKGVHFTVEKVTDNCRLFVGGIPEYKTCDEVWQELLKQGVNDIVNIIMYRSYKDRSCNRGYVFVEFPSFYQAAQKRVEHKQLSLWGGKVSIDWSEPIPLVNDNVMSKVRKLFLRNIEVTLSRHKFERLIINILGNIKLERVYKFKDYAFIHFHTRKDAQTALELLKDYFKYSFIEVYWATPQEFAPKKRKYYSKANDNNVIERVTPQTSQQTDEISVNMMKCNNYYPEREENVLDDSEAQITRILSYIGID